MKYLPENLQSCLIYKQHVSRFCDIFRQIACEFGRSNVDEGCMLAKTLYVDVTFSNMQVLERRGVGEYVWNCRSK